AVREWLCALCPQPLRCTIRLGSRLRPKASQGLILSSTERMEVAEPSERFAGVSVLPLEVPVSPCLVDLFGAPCQVFEVLKDVLRSPLDDPSVEILLSVVGVLHQHPLTVLLRCLLLFAVIGHREGQAAILAILQFCDRLLGELLRADPWLENHIPDEPLD